MQVDNYSHCLEVRSDSSLSLCKYNQIDAFNKQFTWRVPSKQANQEGPVDGGPQLHW